MQVERALTACGHVGDKITVRKAKSDAMIENRNEEAEAYWFAVAVAYDT